MGRFREVPHLVENGLRVGRRDGDEAARWVRAMIKVTADGFSVFDAFVGAAAPPSARRIGYVAAHALWTHTMEGLAAAALSIIDDPTINDAPIPSSQSGLVSSDSWPLM